MSVQWFNKVNFILRKVLLVFAGIFIILGIIYLNQQRLISDKLKKIDPPITTTKKIKTPQSCPKPATEEIENHFKDNSGSLPVKEDFDSAPGEICGNGRSYYCTSVPPRKPIPASWSPPPKPGTDPEYLGPEPGYDFKESPYAMPASKSVLARTPIFKKGDEEEFVKEFAKELKGKSVKVGVFSKHILPHSIKIPGVEFISLDQKNIKSKDYESVAKELMQQQIEYIIYDKSFPEVSPWIEEEMSSLHIRFRDALESEWFYPSVISSGFNLIKIAEPFSLTDIQMRNLTKLARDVMLDNSKKTKISIKKNIDAVGGDNRYRAIVSLRSRDLSGLKGRKLIKRIGSSASSLEGAVAKASSYIKRDWERIAMNVPKNKTINVSHVPLSLKEALENMQVEIEIPYNLSTILERDIPSLAWNIELGLHGVYLWHEDIFHYLEPAYAVHFEKKSEVQFLESMLKKRRINEYLRKPKKKRNYWRKKVLHIHEWKKNSDNSRFGRFRTLHWIESVDSSHIVKLYRGVPLKTLKDVSEDSLIQSLKLGADWLIKNQSEDGQYAYRYTPTNKPGKRWYPGGNIVRHALNPYTLLMVNKVDPDPKYVQSAKKGIDFTLSFLRKKGDRCVICHRDPPARYYNAKINSIAVTVLSIMKLAEVEDISEYHDVLKCFAEEMLYMQDENGHFWQYDVPEDHPYYGADNTIAPGEIIYALSKLYSYFKDERYKNAIDLALPWYMESWRILEKRRTTEGIYNEENRVNLIGIVPWLVTAMNELYMSTGEKRYAEIAFEQQSWIDNEFFIYPDRAKYPDYIGSSFKVHWELPAINSCQYAEGAAAAFNLADITGQKDRERMRKLLINSMKFCLQLQYDSYGSTFFIPEPDEVMGGYRYTLGHLRLRNDYSYHAMAAIAQAVEYLSPTDY